MAQAACIGYGYGLFTRLGIIYPLKKVEIEENKDQNDEEKKADDSETKPYYIYNYVEGSVPLKFIDSSLSSQKSRWLTEGVEYLSQRFLRKEEERRKLNQ